MRGLGWFLLANFELVLLARLAGLDVPWTLAAVGVAFLLAGAAFLLAADRLAKEVLHYAVRLKEMELKLEQRDRELGPDIDFTRGKGINSDAGRRRRGHDGC